MPGQCPLSTSGDDSIQRFGDPRTSVWREPGKKLVDVPSIPLKVDGSPRNDAVASTPKQTVGHLENASVDIDGPRLLGCRTHSWTGSPHDFTVFALDNRTGKRAVVICLAGIHAKSALGRIGSTANIVHSYCGKEALLRSARCSLTFVVWNPSDIVS